jgi:hypothetical protein
MNVYQWVGVFVVVAIFFLVIILPPSLVALGPDTGWPNAEHFYSSSGGKIDVRALVRARTLSLPPFTNFMCLRLHYFSLFAYSSLQPQATP